MNCSWHPQMPRSEDTLTELRYETYLERYHNICHEITAMRTKTAILMGIVGVVFTIILSINDIFSKIHPDNYEFVWIFGGIFLLIFVNYFEIYIMVHLIDLTDYLNDNTQTNLKSDDTKTPDRYSTKILQRQILSDLIKISDNLIVEYKFYRGMSSVVDTIFFVLFGIGGIALINTFLGSPINDFVYSLFVLLFLLLLAGCLTSSLVLLGGIFQQIRDLFMGDYKICVILGCILFTVVVWSVLLGAILG